MLRIYAQQPPSWQAFDATEVELRGWLRKAADQALFFGGIERRCPQCGIHVLFMVMNRREIFADRRERLSHTGLIISMRLL